MSEFLVSEKTWKGIKTVLFIIKVTIYISELLNLDTEITAPNSTLCYENLREFPLATNTPSLSPTPIQFRTREYRVFVQKQHYRFFFITLSITISVFYSYTKKTNPSKHTDVFEREIQPQEMINAFVKVHQSYNSKFITQFAQGSNSQQNSLNFKNIFKTSC